MPVIPVVSKKKRLPSETQEEEKKKDHLNIVFIGHVGQLLSQLFLGVTHFL